MGQHLCEGSFTQLPEDSQADCEGCEGEEAVTFLAIVLGTKLS